MDQLRISINTGRADIVQRLNQRDSNADSMNGVIRLKQFPNAEQRLITIMNVCALIGCATGIRAARSDPGAARETGRQSIGVLLSLITDVITSVHC
jgi:hypothetical protein